MKKRTYLVLVVVLLLTLVVTNSTTLAGRDPDLPLDLEGILHDAAYKIRVPANWNGTLLVYAHGYPT